MVRGKTRAESTARLVPSHSDSKASKRQLAAGLAPVTLGCTPSCRKQSFHLVFHSSATKGWMRHTRRGEVKDKMISAKIIKLCDYGRAVRRVLLAARAGMGRHRQQGVHCGQIGAALMATSRRRRSGRCQQPYLRLPPAVSDAPLQRASPAATTATPLHLILWALPS